MIRAREIRSVSHRKIEERRKMLGFTFKRLGEIAGIAPSQASKLCKGKGKWRMDVLEKTLNALALSPDQVIQDHLILGSYLRDTYDETQGKASIS